MFCEPFVDHGGADACDLNIQAVPPIPFEHFDYPEVGLLGYVGLSLPGSFKFFEELSQRGLFRLLAYFVQVGNPVLKSALGNLPVGGIQRMFFSLAAYFFNGIVNSINRMTILTVKVRDLSQQLTGAAVGLFSRVAHVRNVGGDKRGCQGFAVCFKHCVSA